MSEEKIVEAVGNGKVDLSKVVPISDGRVAPSIAKVRVIKRRDGVVYEDRTVEFKPNGVDR